jgi:outer membrane biosynthesis protein TonB
MGAKAQIWVMVSHKGQAGDFLSAIKVEGRKPSSLGGRPATLYQGRNLDGSQQALMVIADAPDAQGRWLGVVFGGRQLDAFANDVEQIIASLTFNQAARLPASAQAPVQPAIAEPPSIPQPPAPPEDDKPKEPAKPEDTSAVTMPAQEKKVEDATTAPDAQTQTPPRERVEPKPYVDASPDKTSAQTDTQDQQTPPAPTDPKATTPAKPEEPASRVWLVKKKGSADYVGRGEELKGDGSPDEIGRASCRERVS